MRIITCVATFLLAGIVFTSVLACEQPAPSGANGAIEAPTLTADQLRQLGTDGIEADVSLPPKPAIEHGWTYEAGNICYIMHSLIVAREERGSDSTRLVGSRTCTWSSRFQVKRTAPAKDVRVDQKTVVHE